MKTEAYFSVHCDIGLTAAQYRQVQLFAELIPAEVFQDRTSNHRNIHVNLDVVLDSTPGGLCVAASQRIDIGDLLRWLGEPPGILRDRIQQMRAELFGEISAFVQANAEKAAPPMPPEPEPVYIDTGQTICGQKLVFISSGDLQVDETICQKLDRVTEIIKQILDRK